MPKLLEQFLRDLQSKEEIEEMWLWFDGNPDAVNEIIALLANLVERG